MQKTIHASIVAYFLFAVNQPFKKFLWPAVNRSGKDGFKFFFGGKFLKKPPWQSPQR